MLQMHACCRCMLASAVHACALSCACFTCCAVQYLAEAEGLKQLPMPPGGSNTRWPYWIDVAAWFMLVTVRYDNLLAFLLHTWLKAQGDAGIGIQTPSASSSSSDGASGGASGVEQPAALRGTELLKKIQLIENDPAHGTCGGVRCACEIGVATGT
jgi:hypothetical protein